MMPPGRSAARVGLTARKGRILIRLDQAAIEEGRQMAGQASARSRSAGRDREVNGWAVGLIFSAAPGVCHLLVGLGVALAGVAVWLGQGWARVVAAILALASAVTSFLFIPHYPFWSLTIIALDVLVIWALTVHGRGAAA
jgi:hypothetical protein